MKNSKKKLQKSNHLQSNRSDGKVRIACDFHARPAKEQDIFSKITWCDSCFKANLGMFHPIEYKIGNRTYLEGGCTRCGSVVRSEIIRKRFDDSEEDVIWPIQDRSKPPLTYLPRKSFSTFVIGSFSKYGYYPLRTSREISKAAQIVFWSFVAIFLIVVGVIMFNNIIYGR